MFILSCFNVSQKRKQIRSKKLQWQHLVVTWKTENYLGDCFLGEINLFCLLRVEADTIAKNDSFYFEYGIFRVENMEEEISHGSNLLTNSNLVL